jgi:hypothetical protein
MTNNVLFNTQFECENGRIVLIITSHMWHKTPVSTEFKHSTAPEFISHWVSEYSSTSKRKRSHDNFSNGNHEVQATSADSGAAAGKEAVFIRDDMSPSKKAKFIKEGIDETIEKGRVG